LKATIEQLKQYANTLEAERKQERQMRVKLEEEYAENSKNHEDEVKLRMKFEQKLNLMHTEQR
jgi:hypothetical protein